MITVWIPSILIMPLSFEFLFFSNRKGIVLFQAVNGKYPLSMLFSKALNYRDHWIIVDLYFLYYKKFYEL